MENEITERFQVTPCGDFNCQSFPLIEGKIYDISQEELEKLGNHTLKWSEESYEVEEPIYEEAISPETQEVLRSETGTKTVIKTRPILIENNPAEENAYYDKLTRINELKQLLKNTDYQAIKFAEGAMSAEEYEPCRLNRTSWRAEINSLEQSLE